MTKKPQFEQFLQSSVRTLKPMPQQAREPYRQAITDFLEGTNEILVQKARKDGHPDAQIELHCTYIGPSFDAFEVVQMIRNLWPGSLFTGGENMFWVENEEEVVRLRFVWREAAQFLSGLIIVVP